MFNEWNSDFNNPDKPTNPSGFIDLPLHHAYHCVIP
jgi:hypothetical protein